MAEQYSSSTPDVSPERNRIQEEHARKYPEGDPSVRRIRPDHGVIDPRREEKPKAADAPAPAAEGGAASDPEDIEKIS